MPENEIATPEAGAELNGETVDILSVSEYLTYPKVNQPLEMVRVTYQYKNYPPRTIFAKKEDWTPEKKGKLIREDLEKLKKPTTETVEV